MLFNTFLGGVQKLTNLFTSFSKLLKQNLSRLSNLPKHAQKVFDGLYKQEQIPSCTSVSQEHRGVSRIMNFKIALLFFVAVAFYAKAELEKEYHPQAVLHYLEMEDRKMAEKVRSIVKLKEDGPKPSSSPKLPSGLPNGIPPKIVSIRA